MLNLRKPALIFNIIGVVIFFIGLGLVQSGNETGAVLMYTGLAMAIIYWIWSVVDVLRADDLRPYQKKFWLIIVLIVPAIGGSLFHIMHQRRGKIIT